MTVALEVSSVNAFLQFDQVEDVHTVGGPVAGCPLGSAGVISNKFPVIESILVEENQKIKMPVNNM